MAPRDSSKTSTILSKTTPKVISKKSQTSSVVSIDEKMDVVAKKNAALEESRRKRTAPTALKQAPGAAQAQAVSYANVLINKENNNRGTKESNLSRPSDGRSFGLTKSICPLPASNTDCHKLGRPQVSVLGAPAINRIQISERSALGSISGNRQLELAGFQMSCMESKERSTDMVHNPRNFQIGVVYSVATFQWDFSDTVQPGNTNQSITTLGVVYAKYRKFVVIARFATNVVALPVYTHGGRDLSNKPHRGEFVSVRDVDSKGPIAKAESKHNIVWAERYAAFKLPSVTSWFMMSNTTSIQLTAPQSHKMSVKCTISGNLRPTSITYLQKLFREVITSAFAEVLPTPAPDADGFFAVQPSSSRAGSTYGRQGSTASVMRGREFWRPTKIDE